MKKSTEADIEYFKGLTFKQLMDVFYLCDSISIYFKNDISDGFVLKSIDYKKYYIVLKKNMSKEKKKRVFIFLYSCILEGYVVELKKQYSEQFIEEKNKFVEEFNALYNK